MDFNLKEIRSFIRSFSRFRYVRDTPLFDDVKIIVFGHFGKVLILFKDGKCSTEEVQRLVAYQLTWKAIKHTSIKLRIEIQINISIQGKLARYLCILLEISLML